MNPVPSTNMHGLIYPSLDGIVNINPPPYAPQAPTTTLSPTFQHNVSHSREKKYKIFIIFLCIIMLGLIIYILLKRDTHHIIHVASNPNILETRAFERNLTTTTAPPTTAPPTTVPPTTIPPTTVPPTTETPTTALYYTKSFGHCNTRINSYDECIIGAQYLNLKNQTYQFVSIEKTNSTNDVMGCSYNNIQPIYILHFNVGGLASTVCTSQMSCICTSN